MEQPVNDYAPSLYQAAKKADIDGWVMREHLLSSPSGRTVVMRGVGREGVFFLVLTPRAEGDDDRCEDARVVSGYMCRMRSKSPEAAIAYAVILDGR